MPLLLYVQESDLVPILQEAWWAPGPVWMGVVNLSPTGIQSLDRPACSKSLYRLCHPGPLSIISACQKLQISLCKPVFNLEPFAKILKSV